MNPVPCNVCGNDAGTPVYTSPTQVSITSICTLLPQSTQVYFCRHCGHVQTPDLQRSDRFYDTDYKILADSEDEDQIYQVVNDVITYRADHQLDTLLSKIEIPKGASVLDYGCAKATTTRRLLARRPDLVPYLFDVSRDYMTYWQKFTDLARCATYALPESWSGTLDLVTSYFVLEHVDDAYASVTKIHKLLKDGGQLYFIVPDFLANIGDFVVADHTNHFTPASVRYLLQRIGFDHIEVDEHSHISAYVITARKAATAAPSGKVDAALTKRVQEIAAYWQDFARRVQEFESSAGEQPAAIYGSGFYGTFVASCLKQLDRVRCFLDQNPYRQKQTLLDKRILAPASLPAEVTTVYVGLNPARAREEIAKLAGWADKPHRYFYP